MNGEISMVAGAGGVSGFLLPLFFAAAKKSRCRPAQGQRPHTDANTRKRRKRQRTATNNAKKIRMDHLTYMVIFLE